MTSTRFVVLGVAPARAEWFRAVSQWAHSSSVPLEFLKCVSAEEVRARLASGQPFSALIADGGIPAVDRDLVAAAMDAECAVVVVEDPRLRRDWIELGAVATLPAQFDRAQLLGVLSQHATVVAHPNGDGAPAEPAPASERGTALTVAVTGSGGVGVSTAAIALAQGLATERRRRVLLADFCLRAEQAMLHDVGDVAPGVQELVDAHRTGRPTAEDVRALAFHIAERRYDLLLGLRRPRFWSALRPRALEAAFASLASAYGAVVCDVDSDFEGESDGGSLDVEERNALARLAVQRADAIVAVGAPTMKGLHSLAVIVSEAHAVAAGVPVVAVLNRAPRAPRVRADVTAALHRLVARSSETPLFGPLFLPERKVDALLRDGARLPAVLTQPLTGAVGAVVPRHARVPRTHVPGRVRPGTVGTWAEPAAG